MEKSIEQSDDVLPVYTVHVAAFLSAMPKAPLPSQPLFSYSEDGLQKSGT